VEWSPLFTSELFVGLNSYSKRKFSQHLHVCEFYHEMCSFCFKMHQNDLTAGSAWIVGYSSISSLNKIEETLEKGKDKKVSEGEMRKKHPLLQNFD